MGVSLQQAKDWCNQQVGKAMDFDGLYGAQCVDFFNYYYQFLTGRSPFQDFTGVEGAKDLWNVDYQDFNKVANDPNNPNQLPPDGAIIIYDGNLQGSGGYGHVAVVDHADVQQSMVWDQNWGGMYVHHQARAWTGHELGWLVFKGFEQMITLEQLTQLYNELLGRDPDPDGINHYVGNYTYEFVRNDILNSDEYKNKQNTPPPPPPAPEPVPTPIPTPVPPTPGPVPEPIPVPPTPTPVPPTPPTPDTSATVEAMKVVGRNGLLGAVSTLITALTNWLLTVLAGVNLPPDILIAVGGIVYAALLGLDKLIHEDVSIKLKGIIPF